jgi:hypothetical protein
MKSYYEISIRVLGREFFDRAYKESLSFHNQWLAELSSTKAKLGRKMGQEEGGGGRERVF